MNEVSFWFITFIFLGMIVFFAFSWIRDVDEKYEHKLAERDELYREFIDFTVLFLLEGNRDTPFLEWDPWLQQARRIDLSFIAAGIPLKSGLVDLVTVQRDKVERDKKLAMRGGVR